MANSSQRVKKMSMKLEMICGTISTQGRKRGLHIIVSSQRPQQVRKSVITQANAFILHSPSYNDMDIYSEIVGTINSMKKTEMFTEMRNFKSGRAYYIGGNKERMRVRIKKRLTRHTGKTPTLADTLRQVNRNKEKVEEMHLNEADLEELKEIMPDGDEEEVDDGKRNLMDGRRLDEPEEKRGRGRPKKKWSKPVM
jgi:predicted RNA-binding protein YlxR (DUF448 family)